MLEPEELEHDSKHDLAADAEHLRLLQHCGADVKRLMLSRAVKWHSEDRVIRHGNHTIVFA